MSILAEMYALLEAYEPGDTYKAAAEKMLKSKKYSKNMHARAYLIAVRDGREPHAHWAQKVGKKLAAQIRKELVDLS